MLLVSSLGFDIGGDSKLANYVMEVVDKDNSGTIDFIEFLAYVPFFTKLHVAMLENPLAMGDPSLFKGLTGSASKGELKVETSSSSVSLN